MFYPGPLTVRIHLKEHVPALVIDREVDRSEAKAKCGRKLSDALRDVLPEVDFLVMQVLGWPTPPIHSGLLRHLTFDATGENAIADDSYANVCDLVDECLKEVWLWPELVDTVKNLWIETLRVEQTFDISVA